MCGWLRGLPITGGTRIATNPGRDASHGLDVPRMSAPRRGVRPGAVDLLLEPRARPMRVWVPTASTEACNVPSPDC